MMPWSPEAVLLVADVLDRLARAFDHHLGGDALGSAHLAGQHDPVGGAQRLDRDP
jgi:hypothetical protein